MPDSPTFRHLKKGVHSARPRFGGCERDMQCTSKLQVVESDGVILASDVEKSYVNAGMPEKS
jgi:hypothetical protein